MNELPGITKKLSSSTEEGYVIHRKKFDLDDEADRLELSNLETAALNSDKKVVLIDSDKFTFMDKYFVILRYMEKTV